MSIKVALEHRTTYDFAEPVTLGPHVVRLRPAPHSRTPIEAYSLDVSPPEHFVNWQQDPFGNWMARLVFPDKVDHLDIKVGLVADLMAVNPFDFFVESYAEQVPFAYEPDLAADLTPYLRPVENSAAAQAMARALPQPDGTPTVSFLGRLNAAVYDAVAYEVRLEMGVQDPDLTLERGIGSCRDSAWLLVTLLRHFGLAARFVSGYLVQLTSDAQALEGGSGPEEDFTDLHAWAEVFVPGAGWVGLDATSSLFAGEGHIPLSATPHPASAAPITGSTGPTETTLAFHNSVRRVDEDPRTTLPYTPEQWGRIDALGEAVDVRLSDGDVRLTMGGEPTFVSLDDATSAQWSSEADGEEKRTLAGVLAARLQQTYAAGGVVHRGQGKWYPGEPLPRWNIALQWRTDGTPLWQDPTLFADPWAEPSGAGEGRDAVADAEALARRITQTLGLPPEQLVAAYEDPLVALAAEVAAPAGERVAAGADALDADAVRALDESGGAGGSGESREPVPTGWVLPLVPVQDDWRSPRWSLRRGRLVLRPGTSPVGLRLPLSSISWTDPEFTGAASYLAAGPPLAPQVPVVEVVDPDDQPTTAIAVEAREGHVHVFLPPTDRLEDYADVLRLVEVATRRIGCPIVLEGYQPPPDARLTQLVVTPDPGVIEVNVQPTRSWAEQRDLTTTLYEEARLARLATEKFQIDGLHTGTGGGNHLTLGGVTPAESPLLRRPDLLVSLITYWQRHPSLSYLFSGRFIGPTSQAPRFDEGRPEATYEMEIAFAEIERLTAQTQEIGEGPRPWLVDRALRHLLTDLTGNTHRAEFCVDKLYSPDSSRGRLGLLELRGFEMPPHPQMAMVQVLLVRSLVAMFWEQPLRAPLVRWGTRLHEDAMTHAGALADVAEVVADLHAAGIDFDLTWLDPFLEFRFPLVGRAGVGATTTTGEDGPGGRVELELRQAIEPWHVLGEEATGSGTARYVDSSVERLQVAVRGYDPARHLVTCQGVPLPLAAAADGSHHAGVRFRAWAPWSALHPSIAPHTPLVVDVVDVAAGVSLGGATYHVVHPGGRSFETPPVNAKAAEARRAARFEAGGHTVGPLDVAAIREAGRRASSADYPHTLDLRRVPPPPDRDLP